MSRRYVVRTRGPYVYDIVDTSTGYHTGSLYVGADARERVDAAVDELNAADEQPAGGEVR